MSFRQSVWLQSLLLLGIAAPLQAAAPATDAPAIKVIDGFVVERVAATPIVERPLMGNFDDQGRLYIAESAGKNLDAEALLQEQPNFIRRLEDTDGDGHFDRSTIFADRMTMPMGALWHAGALYVASPPYIWRLEDTDDDGVADRREPIVGKFGFIGNAADIHGCFLGPNGRLYWCDGRHGHQFIDAAGHVQSQGKAARIFSCRLDGGDVRWHCGGGMDNPVEVDFTPAGEMLGTVNLMYQKRGDCLVQWMHGGCYPRDDQQPYLAEFKRTGELMPPVLDLGHVAVSGMLVYRGVRPDEPFDGNVFVCEFNTHKLCRITLKRDGSTYSPRREEFLATDSADFHPTDVIQDADGSLLVLDTGGWFRNGCPTSQVAKPDVLGAIYRVRRVAEPKVDDPRGLKLDWAHADAQRLAQRLDDPRPAVRDRSVVELAALGDSAVDVLGGILSSTQLQRAQLNAVWALCRIGTSTARKQLCQALTASDDEVRLAAVSALGSLEEPAALLPLCAMVVDDKPPIRREAATALGRLKRAEAVSSLLVASRTATDRLMDHAITYALIEIEAPRETLAGLSDDSPLARRSALIALDQMGSELLTRDVVAPLLDTDDLPLQQAAIEVISKHAGWGDELVGLIEEWLTSPDLDATRRATARGAILAFQQQLNVKELVTTLLTSDRVSVSGRLALLEAVAESESRPLPANWVSGVEKCLAAHDVTVRAQAVATAASEPETFVGPLKAIVNDASQPKSLRANAAVALARSGQPVDDASWALLLVQTQNGTARERLNATSAIGDARLSKSQLDTLIELVRTAGPVELPSMLRAFAQSMDAETGLKLVAALESAPGAAALSADRLKAALAHFPAEVVEHSLPLLSRQPVGLQDSLARLSEIEPLISAADPVKGKEIFTSAKAACAACHTVSGQGGQVGPDLSKIGGIRTPRDLLESILTPSSTFARGYECYTVVTTRGLVYLGLIARETVDAVSLRTAERAEIRIPRDEIDEMTPSTASIMPEGLDKVISASELADLVSYLQSLR